MVSSETEAPLYARICGPVTCARSLFFVREMYGQISELTGFLRGPRWTGRLGDATLPARLGRTP